MRPIEESLSERGEGTIRSLAGYVEGYVQEQWRRVLRESQEDLLRLYDEAGEPAYGSYARKLFRPVREQFEVAGFLSEPRFPGTLSASQEWGPLEEWERWMWSVMRRGQGAPVGTLVVGLYHDHTRFRVPRAPSVLGLEETDEDAIAEAILRSADRRKGGEE